MNPMQQYLLHLQEELQEQFDVEQEQEFFELQVVTPNSLSTQEKQDLIIDPKAVERPASAYFLYKKAKEEADSSQAKRIG